MKAIGSLIRLTHLLAAIVLLLAAFSFLSSAALNGDWKHRLVSLLVFLVLGIPLVPLAYRVWHLGSFYPPDFLPAHPALAALFAALGLIATTLTIALDLQGEGAVGFLTIGAVVTWLTMLAQELSFRAGERRTDSRSK